MDDLTLLRNKFERSRKELDFNAFAFWSAFMMPFLLQSDVEYKLDIICVDLDFSKHLSADYFHDLFCVVHLLYKRGELKWKPGPDLLYTIERKYTQTPSQKQKHAENLLKHISDGILLDDLVRRMDSFFYYAEKAFLKYDAGEFNHIKRFKYEDHSKIQIRSPLCLEFHGFGEYVLLEGCIPNVIYTCVLENESLQIPIQDILKIIPGSLDTTLEKKLQRSLSNHSLQIRKRFQLPPRTPLFNLNFKKRILTLNSSYFEISYLHRKSL